MNAKKESWKAGFVSEEICSKCEEEGFCSYLIYLIIPTKHALSGNYTIKICGFCDRLES